MLWLPVVRGTAIGGVGGGEEEDMATVVCYSFSCFLPEREKLKDELQYSEGSVNT